jgi:chaperone modulatory protein CbpM
MISSMMRVTVEELCEKENLSRRLLVELIDYEITRPVSGSSLEDWVFDATGAHWLKCAVRLQRDFDLDWIAVAMMVDLLREREQLQEENRQLRQRLGRFLFDEQG